MIGAGAGACGAMYIGGGCDNGTGGWAMSLCRRCLWWPGKGGGGGAWGGGDCFVILSIDGNEPLIPPDWGGLGKLPPAPVICGTSGGMPILG